MGWYYMNKVQMHHVIDQVAPPTGVVASGFILFGEPLEQWVLLGTGVLITLNIALKIPELIAAYRRKGDDDED